MRHRQDARRRFETRTMPNEVEVQNRRVGLVLLVVIVVLSITAVIGVMVLN